MIMMSFENSDGWMLIGPIVIQRWAPSADWPTSMTATSRTRLKM